MTTPSPDVDPYAELDSRADAAELSEGKRLPIVVSRRRPRPRFIR
ncbi:hypothetical protein [Devosia crocina]|nr:hypothetical protein [Devosia crocina]